MKIKCLSVTKVTQCSGRKHFTKINTLSPFYFNRLFSKWSFHFKTMFQNVSFQNHFLIRNQGNIMLHNATQWCACLSMLLVSYPGNIMFCYAFKLGVFSTTLPRRAKSVFASYHGDAMFRVIAFYEIPFDLSVLASCFPIGLYISKLRYFDVTQC